MPEPADRPPLRDQIAEALYQRTLIEAGASRISPPVHPRTLENLRANSIARADAVMPIVQAERKQAIETERAEIIKGIREYFAVADDPLYEDVEVLCGRIERGEYGTGKA